MTYPKSPDHTEEAQATSADTSFGEILLQFEQAHHVDNREALEGAVVAVTAESVFVDIGRKTEGILPIDVFRAASGEPGIQVGDKLRVSVTGRNQEGYYQLSMLKIERPKDWSSLEQAFREKRTIAATVSEVIKGGLRVDVGVRAFLPASRSGAKEQADLEALVGQEIQCRISKLDTVNEDVVVDRRVVLEEQAAMARQEAFAQLQEGAVVRGSVRSLTDFGAFVDLGGFDGLLHVADMSWTRTLKPSDVVSVGDSVEVKILKVNPETRRISLGMKQLVPDPWNQVAEKYPVGARVRGKVSRVADFGAFVELEPGVDGLVHLSEMSWSKKTRKPADIVQAGENVEVIVLSVNAGEHRIGLGLKQALGDPWQEAEKKFVTGTVVEGPVTSLTKFGAFVDLGDGLEGMIHIGDISREKRLEHPREALAVGQKVRAQVLELDRERRRIRLGMKQLEPTTIDEYIAEHAQGETVSGRVIEVASGRARIELGEGVYASCRMASEAAQQESAPASSSGADLSALTAMLSAKWKTGGGAGPAAGREPAQAGQIRTFRIVLIDSNQKKIEVELAG